MVDGTAAPDSHALHAALAAEMEELGLDPQRDKLGGLAG